MVPAVVRKAVAGVVLSVPPSRLAPLIRRANPAVRSTTPGGAFERDDGSRLLLLMGYRDQAKSRWRKAWWATRALLELDARGALPDTAREPVEALKAASTLPAPVHEFARAATAVAEDAPGLLSPTGRTDEELGCPVLAPALRTADVEGLARLHKAGARVIVDVVERLGVPLASARVLEAGCGRGYSIAAVAGLGAGEAVGVDLDLEADALPEEIEAVRGVLAPQGSASFDTGDIRALPYPDASFDAVFSLAVLEHVDDPGRAFHELRRVTRPGGVGYHGVDQWFGPAGGHSLCTLDAPWGHTRLDPHEVERYLRELRPHEAEDALDLYRHGFQLPRLTLPELVAAARSAGFEVLAATLLRLPLRDPHRGLFGLEILRDTRRVYPAARQEDLLSGAATLVLRRP